MSYCIELDLEGFSNETVVKCRDGKSPLEYYARISDENVFNKQLTILKLVWPDIDKYKYLEHVCSSSLDKDIWIYRKDLRPFHSTRLRISNVTLDELNETIKRSFISREPLSEVEIQNIFTNLKYPTLEVDWIHLIKNKCNPRALGLRKNLLYFMSKPPTISIKVDSNQNQSI